MISDNIKKLSKADWLLITLFSILLSSLVGFISYRIGANKEFEEYKKELTSVRKFNLEDPTIGSKFQLKMKWILENSIDESLIAGPDIEEIGMINYNMKAEMTKEEINSLEVLEGEEDVFFVISLQDKDGFRVDKIRVNTEQIATTNTNNPETLAIVAKGRKQMTRQSYERIEDWGLRYNEK